MSYTRAGMDNAYEPADASPLDLFELRHDLAAVSSALRALRHREGLLSRDPERSRRIYELTVERLADVLARLDRHLIPFDPRISK
jgi:hypothetical protein